MEDKKDRFFIPKTIRVGYQERASTYTGKLAYVIYIDQTGKVRKEKSWNSWRNKDIESNDFDNVPTEGFVLNMHTGGYKSGWNFRQSYCRIYDPRGFEFEITIDNLLWILDWEDCYHGKGLSGKFVYGWIYDQLVLIPCVTDDYKISKDISDKMYEMNNVNKDELVPGALYKIKSQGYSINEELVYIGNLKVQQKLGKSYKSFLFFYDINPKEGYYYNNVKGGLIRIDKSAIKCKLSDNAIDKATLDDILYRWSLSAYSYEFWHTDNIIHKFVSDLDFTGFIHSSYFRNTDKILTCNIIDDTHITLYKTRYTTVENPARSGGYYYYDYYKTQKDDYKFVSLDANLNIEKFVDCGKHIDEPWRYRPRNRAFVEWHPDCKENETDIKNNIILEKPKSNIYYITKDGYVSDSLTQLIYTDSLSWVSAFNQGDNKIITLPTKMEV